MKWVGTPLGAQDRLFDACASRRRLEAITAGFLEGRGYREVMTPTVELFDLFVRTGLPLAAESMVKFSDRDGRLVVLRPDSTMPMARVAASKLVAEPLPLRLYYMQDIFRSDVAHAGLRTSIHQAGIELFGADGLRADLEVLALGAGLLETLSPAKFRIEIGHAGLFSSMLEALPVDEETRENLRRLIEQKNFAALGDLLHEIGDSPITDAIGRLCMLFGGTEVFNEVGYLLVNGALSALDELKAVMDALTRAGLNRHFQLDFGLVHQLEYYTGLIFRGYIEGVGHPVLAGGRYNGLMSSLNRPTPAIGFAIDLDALSENMSPPLQTGKKTLIHFSENSLATALALMAGEGRFALSPCETYEESVELARLTGCTHVLDADREGRGDL